MQFVGTLPESEARNYKTRFYSHTQIVRQKKVKYYDCYTVYDEHRPVFREGSEPDRDKIRLLDRIFRNRE